MASIWALGVALNVEVPAIAALQFDTVAKMAESLVAATSARGAGLESRLGGA
jgi:hypothetical protein